MTSPRIRRLARGAAALAVAAFGIAAAAPAAQAEPTPDDVQTEASPEAVGDEGGAPDAEFVVAEHEYTDVAPGAVLTPEVAFVNDRPDPYEGVYLVVEADERFLGIAAQYGNCGADDGGGVVCALPDFTAEPGTVYELDPATPVAITLAEDAPGPAAYRARFSVVTDASTEGVAFFDADAELSFTESGHDLTEGDGRVEVGAAANPYDLAVEDQSIGAADTSLTIPVGNLGPATALAREYPDGSDGEFGLSVQFPSGVSLGETEDGLVYGDFYTCAPGSDIERYLNPDPTAFGVERLDVFCSYYRPVEPGAALEIELPIVVAEGAAKADDGLVVANSDTVTWDFAEIEEHWGLTEDDYPVLDADPVNNTAVLSLASGGSGQLPVTGSATAAVVGAAAAALAAGAVLVTRRRRAAADW